MLGLKMMPSDFRASARAVLELQLSTVPGRLTIVLYAEGVVREAKVLEN